MNDLSSLHCYLSGPDIFDTKCPDIFDTGVNKFFGSKMRLSQFMQSVSPSQINSFISCPAYWASTRLSGVYIPAGPAATRGNAIEAGLVSGCLTGLGDIAAMTDIAHAAFDSEHSRAALNLGNDPVAQQRAHIAPAIANAWPVLKQYGKVSVPDDTRNQWEVVAAMQGDLGITLRGFTDFVFPDAGVIVDLKTTSRVPTQISAQHQRQMAFYAMACPGYAIDVMYVSPAAVRVFRMTPEQVQRGWRQCVGTVQRMDRLMSCADSVQDLCSMLIPNLDSIVWRGDLAQAHLARVFPDFA